MLNFRNIAVSTFEGIKQYLLLFLSILTDLPPEDFTHILKLVKWFSGHCHAIKR